MKKVLLLILSSLVTTSVSAELTRDDREDLYEYQDVGRYEEDTSEPREKNKILDTIEVLILPITQLSGKGKTRNCGCEGEASFYALDGRQTANGDIMDSKQMTAAHNCLPFDKKVIVCRKDNPSKCQEVRINDRGPFAGNRVIDLSKGAAGKLGFIGAGHAQVIIKNCK